MKFEIPNDKKAEVLNLLVTKGEPVGMGANGHNKLLSIGETKTFLSYTTDIDYCNGVPVKADFSTNIIDLRLYARDNTIPTEELLALGCKVVA